MKTKIKIVAGGFTINHNQGSSPAGLRIRTRVNVGGKVINHNQNA
jgi:hypothetical protein